MNINLKTKLDKVACKEPFVLSELEKYYSYLDGTYWWTLAISGLLFLAAGGHLGWCIGIGWLFFSRFISLLLVRWEIAKNAEAILQSEKRNNNYFSSLN